jgi:hypothetical protein
LEVSLSEEFFCLVILTWVDPFIGLLATAIIKMDGVGGLAGWRWIFVRLPVPSFWELFSHFTN